MKAPALNFYLLQATAFFFVAWMFLSWDFSTVGFLPDAVFQRPTRSNLYGYWVAPWYNVTSFQFIYEFIPRPSPARLDQMQSAVALAALVGLLGILPRLMAVFCLILGTHLIGMFLMGNDTMDGSASALMFLALLVAVAPKGAHYRLFRPFKPLERSERYHWPCFLLLFFLSAYYFAGAVNKIFDTVPWWPLVADLDRFSAVALENKAFLTSWDTSSWFSEMLSHRWAGMSAAWVVFTFELFCPLMLVYPRLIPVFLLPLTAMHIGIYLSHSYGYFVNIALDLLAVTHALVRESLPSPSAAADPEVETESDLS